MSRVAGLALLIGAGGLAAYFILRVAKAQATPSSAPFPAPPAPGHTTT